MKYTVKKIAHQRDQKTVTLDDGRTIRIAVHDGDEEPVNIGTTANVGYALMGRLADALDDDTPAGSVCQLVWDFGAIEAPDSLDQLDWWLEDDRTACRLEIWA